MAFGGRAAPLADRGGITRRSNDSSQRLVVRQGQRAWRGRHGCVFEMPWLFCTGSSPPRSLDDDLSVRLDHLSAMLLFLSAMLLLPTPDPRDAHRGAQLGKDPHRSRCSMQYAARHFLFRWAWGFSAGVSD